MQIIDGRKISKEILNSLKGEVESLNFQPIFCDVLVGDDPASVQYVNMKAHKAEVLGIKFHKASFPATIITEELVAEVKKINKIQNMCGIIIQLPLPNTINSRKVLDAIDPNLDVDCLGVIQNEKFYRGESSMGLPTALACMELLDSLKLDNNPSTALRTRKIVVLGQGELVGKPVTAILEQSGLHPDNLNSETENKESIIKNADVIITGIGKGHYIKGDMIKEGVVLIDAGTSESGAGIVGDVDLESVKDIAGYVTPVPGGVGPVTIAMLFSNVLKVAKGLNKNNE